MTTLKNVITVDRLAGWIAMVFITFVAWFGKITYDKLLSMDNKLEMLLVQNGIYKTKIENIESQIKQLQPYCPKNNDDKSTGAVIKQYGILPNEIVKKSKYAIALK